MNNLECPIGVGFTRLKEHIEEPLRRSDRAAFCSCEPGPQAFEKALLGQIGNSYGLAALEQEQ
jgi:hypothetical protein